MRFPAKSTTALAAGALAVAPATAAAAKHGLNHQDRDYLKESAQGVAFEVHLGRTAVRRAKTKAARHLARVLVRDHTTEGLQLSALAANEGVEVKFAPSSLQKAEMAWVRRHHGRAFDKAYAQLETEDHQSDVTAQHMEIQDGRSRAVKAFARSHLPMYKRHLKLSDEVYTKLGG